MSRLACLLCAGLLLLVLVAACTPDADPGATAPTVTASPPAATTPAPSPPATEPEDDPQPTPPAQPLSSTEWTALSPAPTALTEVGAAALAGQIWVGGGLDADGQAVDRVQIFDPTFGAWHDGPALPEALHHTALVSTGDALYVVGGYVGSGFGQPTDAVQRFDTATGAWEPGPLLPAPRAAGAAAWDGARIVYAGGVGPDGLSGEVLVLEDDAWRRLGELSEAREHLGAASDGSGRVWLLGGRTAGLDTNLAAVDLVEGDDIRQIGELPTARGGVAGFWSRTTGACLVGGEAPESTFADVECIDADGEISVLPPLSQPRHGLGAAVVDGVAYVLLGGPQPRLSVSDAVEALFVDG